MPIPAPIFENLPELSSKRNSLYTGRIKPKDSEKTIEAYKRNYCEDLKIAGFPKEIANGLATVVAKLTPILFLAPTRKGKKGEVHREGRSSSHKIVIDKNTKLTVTVKGDGNDVTLEREELDSAGFAYPIKPMELFMESTAHPRVAGALYEEEALFEMINALAIIGNTHTWQSETTTNFLANRKFHIPFAIAELPVLNERLANLYERFRKVREKPKAFREDELPKVVTLGSLSPGEKRVPRVRVRGEMIPAHAKELIRDNGFAHVAKTVIHLLKAGAVYDEASSHNQQFFKDSEYGFADAGDLVFFSDFAPYSLQRTPFKEITPVDIEIMLTAKSLRRLAPPPAPVLRLFTKKELDSHRAKYLAVLLQDICPNPNEVAVILSRFVPYFDQKIYYAIAHELQQKYTQEPYAQTRKNIARSRDSLFKKYDKKLQLQNNRYKRLPEPLDFQDIAKYTNTMKHENHTHIAQFIQLIRTGNTEHFMQYAPPKYAERAELAEQLWNESRNSDTVALATYKISAKNEIHPTWFNANNFFEKVLNVEKAYRISILETAAGLCNKALRPELFETYWRQLEQIIVKVPINEYELDALRLVAVAHLALNERF